MTLVHDPAKVPTGQQVRRLTSQIQGAREGRGIGAVVHEVWYALVTVALSAAFVSGVATTIQEAVPETDRQVLASGDTAAALVLVAVAGGLLSLAGRLGPVGVGGGGAAWWLPMPVDRRGLLRPLVLGWPAAAGVTGAVVAPLVVQAFGGTAGLAGVLGWAAVGAGSFALLTALAAVLQGAGRGRRGGTGSRVVAAAGDVLMLVGTVAVATIALLPRPDAAALGGPGGGGPWALGGGWWLAVPALVAACALTVVAERRLPTLDGSRLRAQGSVGERARVAVLSLDLRELSRALATGSTRARRRRSLSLAAGGPRRAVVLADLVLLGRSPRLVLQVVVTVLLALAATRMSLLGEGLPLYGALVLTGFWAGNTAAAGGRHAEMAPVLDRLLPLSARQVRVVRGTVPLLATTLWAAVVLGSLAARSGDPLWLALAPAWAVTLAAAAVRAAYRPPPNWSRVAVASPMGGTAPTGGLFKGLDVALIGTLPTAVMLFVGVLTPRFVVIQTLATVAVVAVLVAASGRRRPRRT